MKKTLLCILLALLCLASAPACAERDMIDEWYIMMLPEAECGVMKRTETGFEMEGLPYTVLINDNPKDGGIVLLDEQSLLVFSGEFYCDKPDFALCLMAPSPQYNNKPAVLYLEQTDSSTWNTYLEDADVGFFTPTHILTDGERLEYYFVNNRLFLINGNDYAKLSVRWLSDDVALATNDKGVHVMLFIRTKD